MPQREERIVEEGEPIGGCPPMTVATASKHRGCVSVNNLMGLGVRHVSRARRTATASRGKRTGIGGNSGRGWGGIRHSALLVDIGIARSSCCDYERIGKRWSFRAAVHREGTPFLPSNSPWPIVVAPRETGGIYAIEEPPCRHPYTPPRPDSAPSRTARTPRDGDLPPRPKASPAPETSPEAKQRLIISPLMILRLLFRRTDSLGRRYSSSLMPLATNN